MKKVYLIIIILFLILAPLHYCLSARYAVVITIDGTRLEGEISSSDNQIEWRKDIYEHKNQDGNYEKFFLKPGLKGKFRLSRIKEIISINPASAPERYATLEDDSQAKLIQKYRIKMQDGKIFYISDFVTLDSFYIEIAGKNYKRKIYISQIKSLKFTGPKIQKPAAKPKSVKKSTILTSIRKRIKKTDTSTIEPDTPSPTYITFLIILSGFLFIILIILISIMLKYQSRYGKKRQALFMPGFLKKKKSLKIKTQKKSKPAKKLKAKLKFKLRSTKPIRKKAAQKLSKKTKKRKR